MNWFTANNISVSNGHLRVLIKPYRAFVGDYQEENGSYTGKKCDRIESSHF